MKICVMLFKQ